MSGQIRPIRFPTAAQVVRMSEKELRDERRLMWGIYIGAQPGSGHSSKAWVAVSLIDAKLRAAGLSPYQPYEVAA